MLDEHDAHAARAPRGSSRRARPSRRSTGRRPARRAAAGRARRRARAPARRASAPGRAATRGSARRTAPRRGARASRAPGRAAPARPCRCRAARAGPAGSRPWPWSVSPVMTFSSTVSPANRPTPCRVREMPRPASWCGRRPLRVSPRQRSVPSSGRVKPQTTLNSVVLPAPFGPMTPSTSPCSTWRLTALSAVRPPKRTVTPSTSNRPRPVDGALRRCPRPLRRGQRWRRAPPAACELLRRCDAVPRRCRASRMKAHPRAHGERLRARSVPGCRVGVPSACRSARTARPPGAVRPDQRGTTSVPLGVLCGVAVRVGTG